MLSLFVVGAGFALIGWIAMVIASNIERKHKERHGPRRDDSS
jgi:hypothetical protein